MSRIITFGEVMARLAAPGFKRLRQSLPGSLDVTFAGAEVNVAVSLSQFGGKASFVTALPGHDVAETVVANLRGLGVNTRHILRTSVGRLGLYFYEKGVNQRGANVIYDREGSSVSITPPEAYDWTAVLEGGDWFHLSGITPALSRNAAAVALHAVRQAADCGMRVSFDMNFRSRLWQWEPGTPARELATRTVRELMPFVTVFIGGPDDVRLLTGDWAVDSGGDDCRNAAEMIAAKYPGISHVAMTRREVVSASHHSLGGMLFEAASGQAFYAPLNNGQCEPYIIAGIVDRLGGGDAFAAGLIFALTTAELADPSTAVAFAVAASCLAHSIEGDFNFSSRAEVEALMHGTAAGGVNR